MVYLRLSILTIALFVLTKGAKADVLCEQGCFEDYRSCNDKSEVFFTSGQVCGLEQIACRMSCNSGKKMGHYRDLGSFQYSFRPMLDQML